jgi:tellurite resistance protein TehA-like permease
MGEVSPKSAPGPIETLNPAYFALAMATGIVSVGSELMGHRAVALALFWVNLVAYPALWAATLVRLVCYPAAVRADLTSHAKGPSFLTAVAATSLLGSQFWLFTSQHGVSIALWIFAIVLWAVLIYTFFVSATVIEPKPTLQTGINGAWLVTVVATESLAVLGTFVADALPRPDIAAFASLAFYFLGGMLYILLIGLILYQWLFFDMGPKAITPPYWINMGAVAITTLAGSRLLLLAEAYPHVAALKPFLAAFTLFFWATAIWWIPFLVLVMLWKHTKGQVPLDYDACYWSMAFPLGMYPAATWTYATATRLEFLKAIPEAFNLDCVGRMGAGLHRPAATPRCRPAR